MSHTENNKINHLAISKNEYNHHKSDIWKTTVILSILTIVEVVFAILYEKYNIGPMWMLRYFLVVMSLIKAFYIMAVFMHVKYEMKVLIISILAPFSFLIWMLIAFMDDGVKWGESHFKKYSVKKEKYHESYIKDHSGVVKKNIEHQNSEDRQH